MSVLTKDQARSINDRKTQEVEVPAWGGSVIVRSLTAGERAQVELAERRGVSAVVATAALAVSDEHGNALFTEAELEARDSWVVTALAGISLDLSKANLEGLEQAKKLSEPVSGSA